MYGVYGLTGFTGSVFERTKRAWLYWARWGQWELSQVHRIGLDPARVQNPGDLCPVCFGGEVYVRQGSKDRWMRGIAVCNRCHAPVLVERQKRKQKTTKEVAELVKNRDLDSVT